MLVCGECLDLLVNVTVTLRSYIVPARRRQGNFEFESLINKAQ
jgi:hypothetical protein